MNESGFYILMASLIILQIGVVITGFCIGYFRGYKMGIKDGE
jgi:hypothetical protein